MLMRTRGFLEFVEEKRERAGMLMGLVLLAI